MRTRCIGLAGLLLLASCGDDADAPEPTAAREAPIVVYAADSAESFLPAMLANFTRESGIRVTVKTGSPGQIVDDVISNRGAPPADVLLSADVAGIWRAADEGALRPLTATIIERVPEHLRDPDGFWVAARVRAAAIAYDARVVDKAALENYQTLANGRLRGKLCLSSSALSINRSVVAMLIDKLGVRPAELVVRGWIANLALPVFATQAELVAAIDAGNCAVAIVSLPLTTSQDTTLTFLPQPAYGDIEGVGVARHAREPDNATQLIEWLLSSEERVPDDNGTGPRNISVAGWRAEDANKLAERAGYR